MRSVHLQGVETVRGLCFQTGAEQRPDVPQGIVISIPLDKCGVHSQGVEAVQGMFFQAGAEQRLWQALVLANSNVAMLQHGELAPHLVSAKCMQIPSNACRQAYLLSAQRRLHVPQRSGG